jgi:hypothetical protein
VIRSMIGVSLLGLATSAILYAQQAPIGHSTTKSAGPTAGSPSSAGVSSSSPSYAETVGFIQDKITAASYSTPAAKINGVVGNSIGVASTFAYDDAKYTFSVDACQSMTFTSTVNAHLSDYSNDDRSWHHKDGQTVTSYTVSFKSVANFAIGGQQTPAVFSTHEPTQNALGGAVADGYYIQPVLDVMVSQLPQTRAIETGTPDHQDWHDAVWIVPKDLGVSWVNSDSTGDGPQNQTGNITKSGLPILMIRFAKPGTGAESTHLAKAIQHLVDLCVNHAEQGPKQLF